jgi:hypothetical protein
VNDVIDERPDYEGLRRISQGGETQCQIGQRKGGRDEADRAMKRFDSTQESGEEVSWSKLIASLVRREMRRSLFFFLEGETVATRTREGRGRRRAGLGNGRRLEESKNESRQAGAKRSSTE